MNNNDDRKPAPSVAPLDASQINGAFHLLDRDEMVRALEKHSAYTALFSTDAPTGPAITAIIERMHAKLDAATGAAVLTPPHITDAHAARVAQLEADNDTLARLLGLASDEIAVLREQRESVMRQNSELMARVGQLQTETVALLNANGAPVIADGDSFDSVDATFAVLRARSMESQGARVGVRFTRRADGVIDGLRLGMLVMGVGMGEGGEMAVTDGGDVVEMGKAA